MARLGPSRLAPDAKDPLPLSLLSWIPGHRDFSDLRILVPPETTPAHPHVLSTQPGPEWSSLG